MKGDILKGFLLVITLSQVLALLPLSPPHLQTKYFIDLPEAFLQTLSTGDTGDKELWHPRLTLRRIEYPEIHKAPSIIETPKLNNRFKSFLQVKQQEQAIQNLIFSPGNPTNTANMQSSEMQCGCQFDKDPADLDVLPAAIGLGQPTTGSGDYAMDEPTPLTGVGYPEDSAYAIDEATPSPTTGSQSLVSKRVEDSMSSSSISKMLEGFNGHGNSNDDDVISRFADEDQKAIPESAIQRSEVDDYYRKAKDLEGYDRLAFTQRDDEMSYRKGGDSVNDDRYSQNDMTNNRGYSDDRNLLDMRDQLKSEIGYRKPAYTDDLKSKLRYMLDDIDENPSKSNMHDNTGMDRDMNFERDFRREQDYINMKEDRFMDRGYDRNMRGSMSMDMDMGMDRGMGQLEDFYMFVQQYKMYKNMLNDQTQDRRGWRGDNSYMDTDNPYTNNEDKDLDDYKLIQKIKSIPDKGLRAELINYVLNQ